MVLGTAGLRVGGRLENDLLTYLEGPGFRLRCLS